MGSMISLGIGRLEIEWGKNHFFRNHSNLFLRGDIKPEIYYYADNYQEMKPAYSRPLRAIMPRLELLGYSLPECRRLYDAAIEENPEFEEDPQISFETLSRALISVDVTLMNIAEDDPGDYDLGEYAAKAILNDPQFTKTEAGLDALTNTDGTFFENLDSYIILRVLCENPANLDLNVVWRFQDVVDGGWVNETDLFEGLEDRQRYLIVTEGSSDTSVLKAAIKIVAPDVADFFDFVDMSENYPFTGVGNVFRFCQGLSTIRIQNKILVVLDFDTAGVETFQKIRKLPLPKHMRVACLPELEELKNFKTLGPSGEAVEDVNGKAVSIECFLDLRKGGPQPPAMRWTSFNRDIGHYQGELVNKEAYTREFFENVGRDADYDLTKLKYLWEYLLARCVQLD